MQTLNFTTPFPYLAAYLIADVDYVFCQLIALQKRGIPCPDPGLSVKQIRGQIQDIFSIPRKWKRTGVSRQDILQNNPKAQEARELLGEIPEEVLKNPLKLNSLPRTIETFIRSQI